MNDSNSSKDAISVRLVLKVITFIVFVLTFCPMFLVSCSGSSREVKLWDAVVGVKNDYGDISDPHVWMFVLYVIPVVIFGLLFFTLYPDRPVSAVILIATSIELVLWFMLKKGVQKIAKDNNCSFETKAFYSIDIALMIATIVISILVLIKILEMDRGILTFGSGNIQGLQSTVPQYVREEPVYNNQSPPSYSVKPVVLDSDSPRVPEQIIDSEQEVNLNDVNTQDDEPVFCWKCGVKTIAGSAFCWKCGNKLK